MSDREHGEPFDGQTETDDAAAGKAATAVSADDFRILEAVLFASDELLTPAHLKTILPGNPDARKLRSMVEKINVQLQKERHPFEIVEIGGGYQFRTITYYHPWVRQIFKQKAAKKLSIQALECLAIIAYKQPISKAEIELIRGVVSDGAMKTLLEKRLVTVAGRSEKPGRPLLYGTTQTFLRYFGLNRKEDLPRIEEFEAMAREKMEGLSIDDLEQEEIDMKVDAVDDVTGSIATPAAEPGPANEEETVVDIERMSVEDTQPIGPSEKPADADNEPDQPALTETTNSVEDSGAKEPVSALPAGAGPEEFDRDEPSAFNAGEDVDEVEKPTVRMDAVESGLAPSGEPDSDGTAFDLESELLKSSGGEGGTVSAAPEVEETGGIGEVKAGDGMDDSSELETTAARPADMQDEVSSAPVPEMDDEDVFDFEASLLAGSGEKHDDAKKNESGETQPAGMNGDTSAGQGTDWEPEAGIFEAVAMDAPAIVPEGASGKERDADVAAAVDSSEANDSEPSGGAGGSAETAHPAGTRKKAAGDRLHGADGNAASVGEQPAVHKRKSRGKKGPK